MGDIVEGRVKMADSAHELDAKIEEINSLTECPVILDSRVLGAFSPIFFTSWSDARCDAYDSYQTVLHESMHAEGLAGTYIHQLFIQQYINTYIKKAFVCDVRLTDFRSLFESFPRAYDMIFGTKTSHYQEAGIDERADLASSIVSLAMERWKGCWKDQRHNQIKIDMLQGLFQSLCNAYGMGAEISGFDMMRCLKQYLEKHQISKFYPADIKAGSLFSEQFAQHFEFILAFEYNVKIVHISTVSKTFVMFYLLSYFVQYLEQEGRGVHLGSLYGSLINYMFPNAALFHVIYDDKPELTAIFGTTVYFSLYYSGLYKNRDKMAELRSQPGDIYESLGSYINAGFLSKNVDDILSIKEEWFSFYMTNLLGAFPASLINRFDSIIRENNSCAEKEEYQKVRGDMEALPFFSDFYKGYWTYRNIIWKRLANSAYAVPFSSVFHTVKPISQRCKENKTDLFKGQTHLLMSLGITEKVRMELPKIS